MVVSMKTSVVVDASYVLSLLLPDENTLQDINVKMIAPPLLVQEVVNGLRSAVVSGRIDLDLALALIREFEGWPISYQKIHNEIILRVAVEMGLSGYDANYLALSKEMRLPLLTFDKQLKRLA